MENKLKKHLYWFVKNEGIKAIVSFLVLIAILIVFMMNRSDIGQLFDFTIFFSILIAMFLDIFALLISRVLKNRLEDAVKLDTNYEAIAKRYMNNLIVYDNQQAYQENCEVLLKKKKTQEQALRFPVVLDYLFSQCSFEIKDTQKMYDLPEDIKEQFATLFMAHETSNVYNQLNVRVDKWAMDDHHFIMHTSRTTYYNSLVTNRAMDYKWNNGMTTRDFYQYGPYVQRLEESELSNHLGFNGFIESIDGYIPFVKRNRVVSIGKMTYGNSIGASLKTKYALNDQKVFTKEGLEKAILKEIEDELKLNEKDLHKFSAGDNIIAAYRDLVEGGKPQLLFYAKAKLTRAQIEENFKEKIKSSKKTKKKKSWDKELKELEDGSKILWIHKSELSGVALAPDMMVYNHKVYHMMPSAAAAIVMLLSYISIKEE